MTTQSNPAFSVLTLNLRFGLADDGPNAWEYRRPLLRQFLQDFNCDFFTFQEANDFQIDFLSECLPDYGCIGKRQPAPSFWQNNVVFFRPPWELDQWEHFYLSPTPDIPSRFSGSRWPRQCTLGRFRAGPHDLVCGTTHLDFEDPVQVASARLILSRIDNLAGGRPAILAGDFNCLPTSNCHDAFTHPANITSRKAPLFRNVLAPPFPGTYHAFQGGAGQSCIDWILYRGAIRLRQGKVIHYQPNDCLPSDHYPVLADFFWRT